MNAATPSKLLVIVLNYKTSALTLQAAEAALADLPAQNAEMVIVDNASGDGSDVILQDAIRQRGWDAGGRVRLILSDRNGGFGAGNNLGLNTRMSDGSKPDYYFILNSDAFVDRGCIAALLSHLDAHPRAGAAGSHLRGEDGVSHCSAFRFPSIASEFEGAARIGFISRLMARYSVPMPPPETPTSVDWIAGASVMFRAQMLDEIGSFDEAYFLYFEETDLCLRAVRAGWDIWYVPESRVLHIGSVTTGMKTWERMPGYWYDSRHRYFAKNHGRLYALAALAAHLSGGVLHRLRCLLKNEPPRDPAYHLRDLLRHARGGRQTGASLQASGPAYEDRS